MPRWTPSIRLVLIATLCVVVYLLVRPHYYRWVLGPPIDIVVYCDTDVFEEGIGQASVLYDKLALSPIPRMLGLYQNRSPARVQNHYAVKSNRVESVPAGIAVRGVPDGPIRQVNLRSGEDWYFAPVEESTRNHRTLYVFLE